MRPFLLLLLLLSWIPYTGSCQVINGTVCLPARQAAKIADSLHTLPLVRREAAAWQRSAAQYALAARTYLAADSTHAQAARSLTVALADERQVSANERVTAARWKHRARRRGLLNYLLSAVLAGSVYLLVKP